MPDRGPSAGCMIFENKDKHEKHRCTIEFVVDNVSSKMKKHHIAWRQLPLANLGIKEEGYELGSEVNGAWWLFGVQFRWDRSEARTEIEAYLSIENEEELDFEVKASYTFSILNAYRVEMARAGAENLEMSASVGEETQCLLTCEELLKNPLFIEDSLRFRADIEFCILTESATPSFCCPSDLAARSCSAMFHCPKFSDFKLQSEDGKFFHVHKLILRSRSDIFAAMFDHNLTETKTGECLIRKIDGETLEALLKFLYGLNEWKPHLAEKLILAADQYQILDLVDGCAQELISSLTAKNVARILKLGDQLSVGKLKDAALTFIASDLDGFKDAGGLVELEGNIGLLQEVKSSGSHARKRKKQKTTA